ncbi:transposase-like protein, partial [Colletotrichum musicola]
AVLDKDSNNSTLPSSADTSGPPSYKRLRPNSNVPRAKITTLRDLNVTSIVSADLPFVHFENAYVQQMFRYYNPEVASEIPWGRTAIRDRFDNFYRRREALAFYWSISPEITDTDVKAQRMQYYGHILNLAARAFLFGTDKEVLEAKSDFF